MASSRTGFSLPGGRVAPLHAKTLASTFSAWAILPFTSKNRGDSGTNGINTASITAAAARNAEVRGLTASVTVKHFELCMVALTICRILGRCTLMGGKLCRQQRRSRIQVGTTRYPLPACTLHIWAQMRIHK